MTYLMILVALQLIVYPHLWAQSSFKIDEPTYKKSIDLMFSFKMQDALTELDRIQNANPNDPEVQFLKSSIYYYLRLVQINELSDDVYTKEILAQKFRQNIEEAIKLAETIEKGDPNNLDIKLLRAACLGFKGLYLITEKEFRESHALGKQCYKIMKEIYEKDMAYSDAKLGIGLYNYIGGSVPWLLRVLFAGGNKEDGIRQIEQVINEAQFNFTRYFATYYLDSFYYLEFKGSGDTTFLKKRVQLDKTFLEKYPNNYAMKFNLASTYGMMGNKEKAASEFKELMDFASSIGNKQLYNSAQEEIENLK